MARQPHSDGNLNQRLGLSPDESGLQSEQSIRLRGELTLEHRVKAQLIASSFSLNKWMSLFGTAFFAVIPWFYRNDKGFWILAIFCWLFSAGSLLMYWFSPQLDAALLRDRLRRQFNVCLPLVIELRPEGLYAATPDTETIVAWSTFHRIRKSGDMILLFHRGMMQIQIFPREFCESDQQWRRLQEFLEAQFPAT